MICFAPSPEGVLGAWLLTGPYSAAPSGDPGAVGGSSWSLVTSDGAPLDVKKALKPQKGDAYATAGGVLRIARAGRYFVTLGVDDGVELFLDGKSVFHRDDARPERDDDDAVPLDLTAGEHRIALVLHNRDGAWSFRLRLLDASWNAANDVCLSLPGTNDADAQKLAGQLSKVTFDRGLRANGYAPELTIRFPDGLPLGADLSVSAELSSGSGVEIFSLATGSIDPHAAAATFHLPAVEGKNAALLENSEGVFAVTVAGRSLRLPFHMLSATRLAVARARRALAAMADPDPSVTHLADLLEERVARGDGDLDAQKKEAAELDHAAAAIEAGRDPYEGRWGAERRAYRSPIDGHLHEYGLYVPRSATQKAGTTAHPFPLVVALHGMNGLPLAMLRWTFGGDDPKRDQFWEERHLEPDAGFKGFEGFPGFVVTPDAFGNSMYRELGEEDVLAVMNEVTRRYRIDPARTTITGLSMGGIGAASVPLHHPEIFAAAEPLCGYHSYFVRRDIAHRPLRPWERLLAEERSNVEWATNGQNLPLYIVHGTMDLPEANSGILIDRYHMLADENHGAGWEETDEHPPLGHNVWSKTYEDLKGLDWLDARSRSLHPRRIRFRTVRLRDGDDAWVHVVRFDAPDKWGEISAEASRGKIDVTTSGIGALRFDRDDALGTGAAVAVGIDGQMVNFATSDAIALHRDSAGKWVAGAFPAVANATFKEGHISGPIRDAFSEPLLFVYGASDPAEAKVNERVARSFATVRGGMNVKYPVMSDVEFFARGEHLDNDRALFLVGRASTNRVTRELEASFPIRIDGATVVVGTDTIRGDELGAAFLRPNPKRSDRYVVVIEGVDARGTLRALSLPDLLPDFVVYDAAVATARGQLILNAASVREAGFFGLDWSLPENRVDPLSASPRAPAKTAHDATPYLP